MKKILSILLFFFVLSSLAYGQTLPFRTYSIEKGLSEAVVNDMMQESNGYIWIATSYGLNRFDGVQFKNYYEEDGLLNNKIYSLMEDDSGRIWVGTGGGVNVIYDDSIRTRAALKPLNGNTILEIYQDSNNEYWFATDGQGVWHLERDNSLTQYSTVNGLANNQVRDIVEDINGTLWFGTAGGLTRLKNGNLRTFTKAEGLPANQIRDLQLDDNNEILWIATRGGVSRLYDEMFYNFTEKDGLVNNRVQSISLDKDGGIWLGTEEGVSYFNLGEFTNYTVEDGLPNNIIHATLSDRENNIWFGTYGGGISLFLGKHIQNYTIEQGLPNNVVTSITQNAQGDYWIATYGGGMAQLSQGKIEVYNKEHGLVDNKVYTAFYDSKKRLLVGTRAGLSIYEDNTFLNYNETELPYSKIRAIEQQNQSDIYWLGTYGKGALRFTNNQFTLLSEKDSLAGNMVLDIKQAPDGSIWFATYGGMSRYKDGKFTNYTVRDGLPNNGVMDVLISDKGTLWVSTFSGIAYLDDGNFTSVTAEDGLPDDVCYFIIQDDNSRFWIGTNKGVVRFNYEKYSQAENAGERLQAFRLFSQNQGLVANEMSVGAGYKDREGNLWFGTVNGLTRFDPSLYESPTVPPIVHIENVRVSGQSVDDPEGLEISSDERNVTFEFIGINFRAPQQVRYQYRLKNSGENWQHTAQPRVRYSALPAGDYTFQVRARNSNGMWSEKMAQVSFSVLAPFWMQWWFILLGILLMAAIIGFIYNYYRVRKMVDIERMRVRIASDLHDDVGSSLTEIALQSDFLQTTDDTEELKKSVQTIGEQSRRIVSSLDDIVWSIDARNDTLGDLTDRMQDYINNILSDRKVLYHFDELNMDKKLSVPVKENLYLIFKEAINNISKHSNATRVDVYLTTDGNSFNLKISDNGTDVMKQRKTGQGLRNMKMRAKRIDAIVNFKNKDGFTVSVRGNQK